MNCPSEHDLGWYSDPEFDRMGHPYPTDHEPEPEAPTYCDDCGDSEVDRDGDFCQFCTIARADGLDAAEEWYTRQLEAKASETISIRPLEILFLSQMTDELQELREKETV